MTRDELKRAVARAALDYVVPGAVIGVGTGSTTNHFIDALGGIRDRIPAAVASSEATARRLAGQGIAVLDLNDVEDIPVYVDGADEIIAEGMAMIKGGGGALTREKIVAAVAKRFVCIADASKLVPALGRFPLPVEVVPMARAHVSRRLIELGGRPVLREGFLTDNGNVILDVHGLDLSRPAEMEGRIDGIVGVVTNGLFARRGADVALLASASGIRVLERA